MFESHTNLPQPSDTLIEEEMEQMSITEPNTSYRENKSKGQSQARRTNEQASQFWRCWPEDGRNSGSIPHILVVRRPKSPGCLDRIQATAQAALGTDHCWPEGRFALPKK
jgi:hypothetical protein